MPNTPYPHAHMDAKFGTLKKVVINDKGEFTHRCLNCDQPTGYEYEDYCDVGCEVMVTECISCNLMHERLWKWS